MDNLTSFSVVTGSRFLSEFIKPLYGSYCFSEIPGTIQSLLSGSRHPRSLPEDVLPNGYQQYDKVVFFFIDAFGWQHCERFGEHNAELSDLKQRAKVSKLTSQYPSTTAAHVLTAFTGKEPCQSGVWEWNYYSARLDEIISPLLFSFGRDAGSKFRKRNTLSEAGITAQQCFAENNFFLDLKQQGIQTRIYQEHDYISSSMNLWITRGADSIGIDTRAQDMGLDRLAEDLAKTDQPTYFYYYYGLIDETAHAHGPYSAEVGGSLERFFKTFQERLLEPTAKLRRKEKILFIISADHGQVPVDSSRTIYLDKQFPLIRNWIRKNRRGELLIPAGSARDTTLYLEEDYIDQAVNFLKDGLKGRAEVFRTSELINQGMFGSGIASTEFQESIGAVLIQPFKNETVFWAGDDGRYVVDGRGGHGGLSEEEMEIPFLAWEND